MMRSTRKRTRRESAAYRDGVILAQLFTAENALLRIDGIRGLLPERSDISRAVVALGDAIRKANARVDRRPA